MGASSSQSNYCHVNWVSLAPHVYQNIINQQIINHHLLPIHEHSQLHSYASRLKDTHPNIIRLIHYRLQRMDCRSCYNRQKNVDIFIEGNIQKFQSQKAICHCSEIIKGLSFLKKKYGPFHVSTNNIWIKEGKVKVWIQENPFLNEKNSSTQKEMVQDVRKLLKELQCPKNHQSQIHFQKFFGLSTINEEKNNFKTSSPLVKMVYPNKSFAQVKKQDNKYYKSLSFQVDKQSPFVLSKKVSPSFRKPAVNFSYTPIQNQIPLSYIHIKRENQQNEYENVPKLQDFNQMAKTHVGVESDRTQAEMPLRKSFDIRASRQTKIVQKFVEKSVIDEMGNESEQIESVMKESKKFNFEQKVKEKSRNSSKQASIYQMPENMKLLVEKYLKQSQKSSLVESNKAQITKKRQWLNEEVEVSIYEDDGQIKRTQSVHEEEIYTKEQSNENKSGIAKVQMFQDYQKVLKDELQLLFRLYQPEEEEERSIKKKVEEKKANFAELKAEALKILSSQQF